MRTKIAAAIVGTGLAASAAFAGLNVGTANVTLSDPVIVGDKILPSGDYVVSQVMVGAKTVIVFRNDSEYVEPYYPQLVRGVNGAGKKTELTMSAGEDGTLYLKDMFIQGDSSGCEYFFFMVPISVLPANLRAVTDRGLLCKPL